MASYFDTDGEATIFNIGRQPSDNYLIIRQYPKSMSLQIGTFYSNRLDILSDNNGLQIDLKGRVLDDKLLTPPVKIRLGVDSEGNPNLELYDNWKRSRIVIGKTELKNTKTGSTEIRSIGSIVIFDEKGKVIYSVP